MFHFFVGGCSYTAIANHIQHIANWQVRNVASWAGNLMMKHDHPDFPSDLGKVAFGLSWPFLLF
jgi:xanthine dehydrogenase/oxidase